MRKTLKILIFIFITIIIIFSFAMIKKTFGGVWMVFALALISYIYYLMFKRKKYRYLSPKISEKESFKKKKETIDKLYEEKVLTESEYFEKINQISEQEQDKIETEIDLSIKKDIEPLIQELQKLKESNLLSEKEFNKKKSLIEKKFKKERSPELLQENLMRKHNITFSDGMFYSNKYAFETLEEAINFQELNKN